MINVKNRKTITKIANRVLRANKTRNLIAICAIALTTILFTTLLTITGTILHSLQQANFRQSGGDAHGSIKYLTKEQMDELSQSSLIKRCGKRLLLGMPEEAPFNKTHVEISYMDPVEIEGSFCRPDEGRLPEENTNEIACDEKILELLGIEPKVGAIVPLSYIIGLGYSGDSENITENFTLVGWWKHDDVCTASHAVVPLSYVTEKLKDYKAIDGSDTTGTWTLDIYLKNSLHIGSDLTKILSSCGYQDLDSSKDNYISTGVNWAYAGAQLSSSMDVGTLIAIIALLALFILTGYLIIYNIFQISVANDIRFYGLLKTIGTTGKQIRRIINKQAIMLSIIGIPPGLIIGFMLGNILTPIVMSILSYKTVYISVNPVIFFSSALFSLLTVFISCRKPGKTAAKVSAVEAVRYTENVGGSKRKIKKGKGKINIWKMAMANLGRNRKKTVLVVFSLSLAVVLLQTAVTFANGFNMDLYIKHFSVSDFILANTSYFNYITDWSTNEAIETAVEAVKDLGNFADGGYVYQALDVEDYVDEDFLRSYYGKWNSDNDVDNIVKSWRNKKGDLYVDNVQLYGMEDFPLSKLEVIDGDISALKDKNQNAIAAVYNVDDYGNPEMESQWAKVGDKITLNYVDEYSYYDSTTGKKVEDIEGIAPENIYSEVTKTHEVTYTVVATIKVKYSMSFRYYSHNEFVLGADVFKRDTNSSNILNYLFDTTSEGNAAVDNFLADYTKNVDPSLNFDSKQKFVKEFKEVQNMFLLMGCIMSFIVGVVGVLNFLNAIVTSIMTRKREFAMLQSIGMTGKQLKQMLIAEGLWYTFFTIIVSLVCSLIAAPIFNKVVSSIIWFFKYKLNCIPFIIVTVMFLIMGIAIPAIAYHVVSKDSIVERLRDIE